MVTLIKKLRNNRKVVFDRGSFDDWCVYVVERDGSRNAPRDSTYFASLQDIAGRYGANKVYDDFVNIYDRTDAEINDSVLTLIDEIVATYDETDQIIIEQWLSVIYGGMIAEEKKENAILKKRIKRLGLHQVLILGDLPAVAANFSKGKGWRDLDAIMRNYGF
jgi:hypothetical protein